MKLNVYLRDGGWQGVNLVYFIIEALISVNDHCNSKGRDIKQRPMDSFIIISNTYDNIAHVTEEERG